LQSGVLWATDISFLNDAEELSFARGELFTRLRSERLAADPSGEGGSTVGARTTLAYIDRAVQLLDSEAPTRLYVACLCANSDLLSQWRGYAFEDGFALGLETAALGVGVACPAGGIARLRNVSYGLDETTEIDHLVNVLTRATNSAEIELVVRSIVGKVAYPMLASIKHPAFREECESRLILNDEDGSLQPEFRIGTFGVIPYVSLDVRALLREVIVGPGRHQDVKLRGVRRLLDSTGHLDVTTRVSAAPLR
jgi:hypothetical protein